MIGNAAAVGTRRARISAHGLPAHCRVAPRHAGPLACRHRPATCAGRHDLDGMRTLRGTWPACWKLLLCALLPLSLRAQDPATLREHAKAVLAQQACQDHLPAEPHGSGGDPGDVSSARKRSGTVAPGEGRQPVPVAFGGGLGFGFATLLLWTVVGVAVAGIVAMVLRSVGERAAGRAAAPRARAAPDAPAAAPADALPDPEAFAAAGDF